MKKDKTPKGLISGELDISAGVITPTGKFLLDLKKLPNKGVFTTTEINAILLSHYEKLLGRKPSFKESLVIFNFVDAIEALALASKNKEAKNGK